MAVVTQSLTIGQLTFSLRAIIQVLSLAGPFLIGFILLSNARRTASFETNDVINSTMGKLSVTRSSLKWLWNYIRRNTKDPIRSFGLPFSIALLVLYALFTSLSDIGFLGFYTCSAPVKIAYSYDKPSSITNDSLAYSAIVANFVNGSDRQSIKAYRCDSSSSFGIDPNMTLWQYMLLPRVMSVYKTANAVHVDTGSKQVEVPTISGGILVNPTDTGVQAVFGVPNLTSEHGFTLDKTMALEIETGCMSLGIRSIVDAETSQGADIFRTNGTWRDYSGPDILYEVLSNTTDAIREYWKPIFNTSTLDFNGAMATQNTSLVGSTNTVAVKSIILPRVSLSSYEADNQFTQNCTNALRRKLGLPEIGEVPLSYSCSLLDLFGPVETGGKSYYIQNHMINMVTATVRSDKENSISLQMTRLPSDLNFMHADYWDVLVVGTQLQYSTYSTPIRRYTLSDTANGPLSHYIGQETYWMGSPNRAHGPANGGFALPIAGTRSIMKLGTSSGNIGTAALEAINPEEVKSLSDPSVITRWSGRIAASFILASLQYNPWVALEQSPILVTNYGDQLAICYHPVYILGFVPLVLFALLILKEPHIRLEPTSNEEPLSGDDPVPRAVDYLQPSVPEQKQQDSVSDKE
ncbi:hypothetical protein CPB86DRAFT_800122 [Serendipita vermifera]|nr:hypothetical protein CPB86DRAFT_800122 [Serendipita vermifera]